MQPIDFIRSTPPFQQLTEEELQQVARALRIVRYPAGTVILARNGPPSRHLYLIREGAVRMERDGQPVMVLEEGECFDFPSLLSQQPPIFDVVTEEESLIYQIPESVFRRLLQNPAFAEHFLQGLSQRLRRAAIPDRPNFWGDFTSPAESLIQRSPLFVPPEATVAEAARTMHQANISSVLISSDPPGIITVRDLRSRVLAQERPPDTPVQEVMSVPVKTLPAETPIYGALLWSLEEQIHHLVLEREGTIVGVITDTDLLRHQTKNPLFLLERVRQLEPEKGLPEYAQEVCATVETLFRGGLEVAQIGRVVASLNDALIARLLHLAEEELGPPPTPYAWIVFGSEGRMEQTLLTDQDNALVYAAEVPGAADYFAQLSQRVIQQLIQAGFPPCPGGYMATNWRRPLDQWLRLFQGWIETPEPQALVDASIFFDFRPVYGALDLEPLEALCARAGEHRIFLAHMARLATHFQPPLGFFRRIRQDEEGKVDLKRGGVAPIVALARVYALESGVRARPTLDRLEAAVTAGALSREGAETLAEAFRFLLHLRLREQLKSWRAGEPVENSVKLDALSNLERRHLKEAFLAIREMQAALEQRFQVGMLG